MERRLEDDIAGLQGLIVFLMKRVKEATARAEALRYLLEVNGQIDRAAYERTYADALAQWDQALGQAFSDALRDANAEAMTKLLQTFEGKAQ